MVILYGYWFCLFIFLCFLSIFSVYHIFFKVQAEFFLGFGDTSWFPSMTMLYYQLLQMSATKGFAPCNYRVFATLHT